IYQIRLTCNELRPPLLKEYGISESLKILFNHTQLRSDYLIRFEDEELQTLLDDEQSIGIYRIVQELLANASKHSNASQVDIWLFSDRDHIYLRYQDNGIGMNTAYVKESAVSMGLNGIIERVRSLEGAIEMHSERNHGLQMSVALPVFRAEHQRV
ncbi:MAG: hypothetical protein K0S39_5523, partial [Paenibacillus sp.]|nr:hypothetical protein [Paenibacillus sp.]